MPCTYCFFTRAQTYSYMEEEKADHWRSWQLPVSPSPLCPSHSHVAKVYSEEHSTTGELDGASYSQHAVDLVLSRSALH